MTAETYDILFFTELAGLPVFDDPLPGQPENLFLIIRHIIGA